MYHDKNKFYSFFYILPRLIADVLASQDQSGGDATVTIDQRKFWLPYSKNV